MTKRKRPASSRPHSGVLPEAFRDGLKALLPEDHEALELALGTTPPVSIRVNPAKTGGPAGEAVPWCSTGRYLPMRPSFTLDPLFHAGAYYVQEASSMFLEQALKASGLLDGPILALDLCAAPGGKTTLLRSLLHPDALVVANEVDRRRQAALQENLWKWGMPNVVITGSDPADLARIHETFHLIVVDAPCSGEGMFRKDPFAREQWSEGLVAQCAALQERIVEQAWNALMPGGILIYSTCTWESTENEDRLEQLAAWGAEPVAIPIDPVWGITLTSSSGLTGHRFYPHRVRGEGFFLGIVRKPGRLLTEVPSAVPSDDHPEVRAWSHVGKQWHLSENDGVLHAVDVRWKDAVRTIGSALRMVAPGRPIAENKGGEWRPHPALALDITLRRSVFNEVELDHNMALAFLRGQALVGEEVSGPGLAVHQGTPLGWLNGAGNRWNNRWPGPWRIRMH
jgi:16S rRNA C967 or C1407 C5-methylase (RsmB/RsmF family)